jgi:mono/diheme cytochrome c family protein
MRRAVLAGPKVALGRGSRRGSVPRVKAALPEVFRTACLPPASPPFGRPRGGPRRHVYWTGALVAAAMLCGTARADDPGVSFFEARIRPVLVEHCVKCHGPEKARSGLRLDRGDLALKGGDGGPVILPGKPEESRLVEAVRQDGELVMPPKARLPEQAIADLEAWVRMGAPWPSSGEPEPGGKAPDRPHWAFQPVAAPEPPPVRLSDWPRDPIDRFILARLEEAGLAPSPEAARRTWLRRVSIDLTGLPPTPDQLDAFERDPAPDASERVVDRLLASPQYGERWARHWLDLARYADTKGYVFFEEPAFPWAYTYRDYVIHALNEDRPYDQFIVEQLAADRLDLGEDRRPLAALGFLTLGGRFMNNAHDIIDDRIDVVSRGLLGLTLTCARCHDHKFDPLTQQDYYALYGVFASAVEPTIPPLFEPEPTTDQYRAYKQELLAREAKLTEFVRAKHEELVRGSRLRAGEYMLAAQKAGDQPSTENFMLIADGDDLNPTMLVRWQTYLSRTRKGHDPIFAPWHELAKVPPERFSEAARALAARLAGPGDPERPVNAIIARAIVEQPPDSLEALGQLYATWLNRAEWLGQDWAQRQALNGTPDRPYPDPALMELRRVFHGPDAPPAIPMAEAGDLALLPDRPSQARLQELRKAVETWRATAPGAPPRAMTLQDLPAPVEPRVFLRGNPNNPGEPVPRRFIAVLEPGGPRPFREGSGRLELARAIVDRRNPLTARVLVNRVWMHHFGTPLVGTPSDFGLRSEPPTHSELLDHLAATFMDDGWSLKRLHRRIVLSATYRQASDDRTEARARDPDNRLYWRMNRRRLDLESLRDGILFVSGRLDLRVGGPSFADIADPASTRRTLYGSIDRLNLPGLYRTFDFPDPNATSPRRDLTTVPPQALFLMNHAFLATAARAIAKPARDHAESGSRIALMYRAVLGRPPDQEEQRLTREFLGEGPDEKAWARLAHALLMTNEFATVD